MKEKLLSELKQVGKKVLVTIILTLTAGGTLWAYAAFTEPATGPADSVQDFVQNILGANNANNAFDSSSVAANKDGSLAERAEYQQVNLLGQGTNEGILGANNNNNEYDSSTVASNADGSAIERLEYIQANMSSFVCNRDTVQDADGNYYRTLSIGTQCWMAENLKRGTRINGASNQTNNGTVEKYCYSDDIAYCNQEGGLYQWDEAMGYSTTEGAQGICPSGWHIPTDAQQHILDRYLTDAASTCDAARNGVWDCSAAGTKLKTGGTSGFNGPLAGYRNTDGSFGSRGTNAYFWSSTESGASAWYRALNSGYATVYRGTNSKARGFSVRCLKD